MKTFRRWFWTKFYTWLYSDIDPNVCCCGMDISKGSRWACGTNCRSEKEYMVTCAVRGHVK